MKVEGPEVSYSLGRWETRAGWCPLHLDVHCLQLGLVAVGEEHTPHSRARFSPDLEGPQLISAVVKR